MAPASSIPDSSPRPDELSSISIHTAEGQQIISRILQYLSLPATTSLHTLDAIISNAPALQSSFTSPLIKTTRPPKSPNHQARLCVVSSPAALQRGVQFMHDVQRLFIPDELLENRPEPEPAPPAPRAAAAAADAGADTAGLGLEEHFTLLSMGELRLYADRNGGAAHHRSQQMSPLQKEVVHSRGPAETPTETQTPGSRAIPARPKRSAPEEDKEAWLDPETDEGKRAIARIKSYLSIPVSSTNAQTLLALRPSGGFFRAGEIASDIRRSALKSPPLSELHLQCSESELARRRSIVAAAEAVRWPAKEEELRNEDFIMKARARLVRKRVAERGIARIDPPVMLSEVQHVRKDPRTRNRPGVKRRRISLLRTEV